MKTVLPITISGRYNCAIKYGAEELLLMPIIAGLPPFSFEIRNGN